MNTITIGSMEWFPVNSFPLVLDCYHNYDLTFDHLDCFSTHYPSYYNITYNDNYPPFMAFTCAGSICREGDNQAEIITGNCSGYDVYAERKKNQNQKNQINSISLQTISAKIYPNPSNGNFILSYSLPNGSGELIVTDISGRKIFDQIIFGYNGKRNINVSNLINGVYYWHIVSNNCVPPNGKIVILK